jgi:beta-glucosidase
MRTFPKGFIWGAATASYQIEGAVDEDGRGRSIWDDFSHTPGKVKGDENGDVACDHYHRYPEDLEILKSLNFNAYRFSLAWSRILPSGRGSVNQRGIDFYSRLVDGLLERGITPFATLFHWDLPSELMLAGGWTNRRLIDWFGDYAEIVFRALGDRVTNWMTINEPGVVASLGYADGMHAPGVRDLQTSRQVLHHLLLAHARGVKVCRATLPKARIGLVPNLNTNYPATNDPRDAELAELAWQRTGGWMVLPLLLGEYPKAAFEEASAAGQAPHLQPGDLDALREPGDFLGVNHYFSFFHTHDAEGKPVRVKGPVESFTGHGWPIHPPGLTDILLKLSTLSKLPLYVTENGAAYYDERPDAEGRVRDADRVEYFRGFLGAAHEAIQRGANLQGYFAWSLLDNFEWAEGYRPRFGIVHVDFATQKRTPKDSARFIAEVARENGL